MTEESLLDNVPDMDQTAVNPATGLKALVVEDDEDMRRLIEKVLSLRGHQVTACADAETGWDAYQKDLYQLVFLDWQLPGIDGIELCRRIRALPGGDRSIIVMITARDQPDDLQTVLGAGANDYMAKPVDVRLLKVRLAIAEQWARNLEQQRQAEQALRASEETLQDLRRQLEEKGPFHDLLGKSTSMRQVYEQIRELSKVDTTVLIEGETGTGKELVARAIHFASPRKANPFIAVNCAGLTDSLLASQLFGHKKGAFTGAIDHQQGLFEAAHGGTLFLDEIGDISASVQTSLLRVLQEKEITRLGESRPRKIDVRVLTATHHNLSHDVMKGTFRADLLYRIRVARIQLPSLRHRRDDIPLLVASFLGECCAATGKPVQDISREAMHALKTYNWPGNVRELKSAIECAVIVCKDNVIQVEDLPPEIVDPNLCQMVVTDAPQDEKSRMIAALESARGNRTMAARLLGMSRATLYRRLAELDLPLRK
ncbi:MAG: sigma-54-dependent transcriptional regulator [Nitrospiraceae bacterium]